MVLACERKIGCWRGRRPAARSAAHLPRRVAGGLGSADDRKLASQRPGNPAVRLSFWPVCVMVARLLPPGREMRDWMVGTGGSCRAAFLLRNLDVFRFRLQDFLPLVLVVIGLRVMFGRREKRRHPGMPGAIPPVPGTPTGFGSGFGTETGPRLGSEQATAPGTAWRGAQAYVLRAFAILWGIDRRHRGPVAHVEVSAVMGGCDIDLRDAVPTTDPLVIQVFAMWGGIDLRVPPGWLIQNEAGRFGGRRQHHAAPWRPRVIARQSLWRVESRSMAGIGGRYFQRAPPSARRDLHGYAVLGWGSAGPSSLEGFRPRCRRRRTVSSSSLHLPDAGISPAVPLRSARYGAACATAGSLSFGVAWA